MATGDWRCMPSWPGNYGCANPAQFLKAKQKEIQGPSRSLPMLHRPSATGCATRGAGDVQGGEIRKRYGLRTGYLAVYTAPELAVKETESIYPGFPKASGDLGESS